MPAIDENRLKANYGTAFVTHLLCKRCLVRPVAEGTDIGVDLYCESVTKDGQPFQHFWVQVKTGDIQISEDKKTASYRFKTDHLYYWARQPVPVFAFLVPVQDWPFEPPKEIYIVDTTLYTLCNEIPNQSSVTILSLDDIQTLKPEDPKSLDWFVYQHVPFFAAALRIRDGVVAPVEEPHGSQYRITIPHGFTPGFVQQILETMRRTAAFAAIDLSRPRNRSKKYPNKIPKPPWKPLIDTLEHFDFDRHYEDYVAIGTCALAEGDIARANEYKRKACAGVEGDQNLNPEAKASMRAFIESAIPDEELKKQN